MAPLRPTVPVTKALSRFCTSRWSASVLRGAVNAQPDVTTGPYAPFKCYDMVAQAAAGPREMRTLASAFNQMATDLAEVVGAALGLYLLFGIPLFPAALITGIDMTQQKGKFRFRLKASFPIASYRKDTRVVLRAMKRYGLVLADNGAHLSRSRPSR